MNVKNAAEKWREIVQQFETSGVAFATVWCKEHGIAYDSFIFWRRQLRNQTLIQAPITRSSFVELAVQPFSNAGIEIQCCSYTLVLHKDFDEATLLRCLQLLEKV